LMWVIGSGALIHLRQLSPALHGPIPESSVGSGRESSGILPLSAPARQFTLLADGKCTGLVPQFSHARTLDGCS